MSPGVCRVRHQLSERRQRRAVAQYTSHGITLEIAQDGLGDEPALSRFLEGLWWDRTDDGAREPRLRLTVRADDCRLRLPHGVKPVAGLRGFRALAVQGDCYLTDGGSLLHVQPERGRASARLAPDFFARPPHAQHLFWMYGLLKLLRAQEVYWLHAAGAISRGGVGVLIIGPSGSGKSSLTINLIRQGWAYLSDDALLLRRQPEGIVALGWRRHVYVAAAAATAYADLSLGDEAVDLAGKRKRRVEIDAVHPGQREAHCLPRVLLFPHVVPHAASAFTPLDRATAMQHLLAQSGPPLFDRSTMTPHLEVLRQLVQQATPYALRAGLDVYHDPQRLDRLLAVVTGEEPWPSC
jgi:hypothetical protein